MSDLPTHEELYAEFETAVKADADSALNDFRPLTLLDLFAGLSAISGRQVMRFVSRQMLRAFVQTAEEEELDFVVADRVGDGITRFVDESDEDYRARYYQFIEALGPGSDRSWRYFVEEETPGHDVTSYNISEDTTSGLVTIQLSANAGESATDIADALRATYERSRVLGVPVNVEVE